MRSPMPLTSTTTTSAPSRTPSAARAGRAAEPGAARAAAAPTERAVAAGHHADQLLARGWRPPPRRPPRRATPEALVEALDPVALAAHGAIEMGGRDDRRVDDPRADRAHVDAARRQLGVERLRETHHRVLRGRRRGPSPRPPRARPSRPCSRCGRGGPGRACAAGRSECREPRPSGSRRARAATPRAWSGPPARRGPRRRCCGARPPRCPRRTRARPAPRPRPGRARRPCDVACRPRPGSHPPRRVGARLVHVDHVHLGAEASEQQGGRTPDSGAGAGDHRHLAREVSFWRSHGGPYERPPVARR